MMIMKLHHTSVPGVAILIKAAVIFRKDVPTRFISHLTWRKKKGELWCEYL